MKTHHARFTPACCRVAGLLALLVLPAKLWADLPAGYLYVSTSGADSPEYGVGYTTIQGAINASSSGNTVWIEDGFVCNAGGTFVSGAGATNRIVLNKAITLRSVSGTKENAAVIVGAHHAPGVTINGTAAIRCLYVTAQATLIGMKLTNGATSATTAKYGGGAYLGTGGTGATFSNCVIVANNAADYGGGVYGGGVFSHCSIVANYALSRAGGVYGGTLRDCDITDNRTGASGNGGGTYGSTADDSRFVGNFARIGSGAYAGTLSYCTLVSNSCEYAGGGAASATLSHCQLAFNKSTTQHGGGSYLCTLSDCVLTGNTASYNGAAIFGGSALRCIITNNANSRIGGGVIFGARVTQSLIQSNTYGDAYNGGVVNGGSLLNCLLRGNSAVNAGGAIVYKVAITNSTLVDGSRGRAAFDSSLVNTIVWNNPSAGSDNKATNSLIAASAVVAGKDNLDTNPLFVGSGEWPYRLQGSSPCIDYGIGGFAWMLPADPNTRGLDYSGRRRVIGKAVDLGAFEFMPAGTALIFR
jgi:hypothetical protein